MMDIKNNKYVVYSIIVLLVAVVAFNFEEITGYAGKELPTKITITNLKSGDVLSDRVVARLNVESSFPNQRIRVYRERGDRFMGYTFRTENCVTKGSSTEYSCEGDLYVTSRELTNGERYYFRALDRKGILEGNKAIFMFKA